MRNFYMSSLQSFLWNKAASQRAAEFGIEKVVLGDLVIPSTSTADQNGISLSTSTPVQSLSSQFSGHALPSS